MSPFAATTPRILIGATCLLSHSAVFRDCISKRYDPFILFVDDRINAESFLIEKLRIRLPWFFRSFNKLVHLSRRIWNIAALNRGFLKRLRFFPLIVLAISWTQWNLKFSVSVPFSLFFGIGHFRKHFWWFRGLQLEALLIQDSEAFKRVSTRWAVIRLMFSCFKISVYLKAASNKVHISILYASIRRSGRFATFYQYK